MLCEYCINELNGACYAKRTMWMQLEQRGGQSLKNITINVCHAYRGTTMKRKEAMRREAAWRKESEKWMKKKKR